MKILLDLLPGQRKKELKRQRIFRKIVEDESLFLLPLLIFIIILLNVWYLVGIKKETYAISHVANANQDDYKQLSTYEERFGQVNETVSKLAKIQANHLFWSEIIKQVSVLMPENISITNFSTKNFKVFLIGKAKFRDDLLKFKTQLDSSDCFQDVNVPLSDLVVKNNLDFQMDFTVNSACLKKQ